MSIFGDARNLGIILRDGIGILANLIIVITQQLNQIDIEVLSICASSKLLIASLFERHTRLCGKLTTNSSCLSALCCISITSTHSKIKSHLLRCYTFCYHQFLGQSEIGNTIFSNNHRLRCDTFSLIIAFRRKRCGCADGEHHGGSQNAREEFLQFHCYSSLVRNSSYSCAAAQTPRFTGRMPAASSGFRGITNCVAAVV